MPTTHVIRFEYNEDTKDFSFFVTPYQTDARSVVVRRKESIKWVSSSGSGKWVVQFKSGTPLLDNGGAPKHTFSNSPGRPDAGVVDSKAGGMQSGHPSYKYSISVRWKGSVVTQDPEIIINEEDGRGNRRGRRS